MAVTAIPTTAKGFGSSSKVTVSAAGNNSPEDFYIYIEFSPTTPPIGYKIQAGDYLHFDIYCRRPLPPGTNSTPPPFSQSPNTTRDNPSGFLPQFQTPPWPQRLFGLELIFTSGIRTGDFDLLDQRGHDVAYGDRGIYVERDNRWWPIIADLTPFVGSVLDKAALLNENNIGSWTATGPVEIIYTRYIVDFRNIRIINHVTSKTGTILHRAGDPVYKGTGYGWGHAYTSLEGGFPDQLDFLEPVGGSLFSGPIAQPARASIGSETFHEADYHILIDATNGNRTGTLPSVAANIGRRYRLTKTDSSANTVTMARAGSDVFLGGATSKVLSAQGDFVEVEGAALLSGTVWMVAASRPSGL